VREKPKSFSCPRESLSPPPRDTGYDLWNEHSYHGGSPSQMYCYCEATQSKFREWLKNKYGTLEKLGQAWHRYSFASWDNVRRHGT